LAGSRLVSDVIDKFDLLISARHSFIRAKTWISSHGTCASSKRIVLIYGAKPVPTEKNAAAQTRPEW